jgi:hypothetical protein
VLGMELVSASSGPPDKETDVDVDVDVGVNVVPIVYPRSSNWALKLCHG